MMQIPLQTLKVMKIPLMDNGTLSVAMGGDPLPAWVERVVKSNKVWCGDVTIYMFVDGARVVHGQGSFFDVMKPGRRLRLSK
jgi:hypothetical protein